MIFTITRKLIDEIENSRNRIKKYPYRTKALAMNINFTPDWIIENMKDFDEDVGDDMEWICAGHFYQKIFDEFREAIGYDSLTLICDSNDIKEDYPFGDYTYYAGAINGERNAQGSFFIYADSPNEFEFDSRLYLFTRHLQIELIGASREISIYESNPEVHRMFFDKNKERLIMDHLRCTTRDVIDI